MKRTSRTRLLEVTARLLREQGYAATTLNQILDQSKCSRSSLYFFFPNGKVELATAALHDQHQQLMQGLQKLQVRYPFAGDGIPGLFHFFAKEMEESDFTKASALAAVTLGAPEEGVRLEVSRCYRELRAFFQAWLVRSGVPTPQAAQRAQLALTLLEGALVLCKAQRSSDPLRQAVHQLVSSPSEPSRALRSACQAAPTEG